jgi:hypothetical protein
MAGAVSREDRRPDGWREIRHYAYVERPFDDVSGLLARSSGQQVLGRASEASYVRRASLHVKRAGVEMSRDVRLRFGGIVCDEQRARLSLRWEDAHHPHLFPVLEAVLELAPLKSGRHQITQIGIVGHYRPPFGVMGGLADRLAGEAVAEESVARFLEDVSRRVEDLITEPAVPEDDSSSSRPPADSRLRRVFMPVDRLDDRPGGAACVGRYLDAAPGVVRAEIHPLTGMATVEFDPELCDPVKLLEDLEEDREWFRDGLDHDPPPIPGSDL